MQKTMAKAGGSEMTNVIDPETIKLFNEDDFKIVYDCLNGKGNSCITGRNIAVDRIQCALRKTFNNNSSEITRKLKAIELEQTKKKTDKISPKEEFEIRTKVIDQIKDKLSLYGSIEGFHKGAKVKISQDSEYADQNSGIGTLQDNYTSSDSEAYAGVEFEDGYDNQYRRKDLFLVNTYTPSKKDFATVKKVNEENRTSFLERIVQEITDEVKTHDETLEKLFLSVDGFAIGDDIVMNDKADETYTYSRKGSKGKVTDVRYNKVTVKFSYLSHGGDVGSEWDIETKYMNHEKPKLVTKRTSEEIYNKINYMIKEILSDILNSRKQEKSISYSDMFQKIGMEKLIQEKMFIPINENNYALNFSDVTKFVAPKLHAMYADPKIYSSGLMVGPPAERQPNVLKLELTDGCNHNKCTYCDRYNGIKHKEKTAEEFIKHVDMIDASLDGYRREIKRVFIGSGNGLEVNQETLKKSVKYVEDKFRPKRISIYANTQAMLKKDIKSLEELKDAGLSCIYRGAESGSDNVLQYVNKGNTFDEMLVAGNKVNEVGIDLSVMLMPGLGGKRFSQEHVQGIAKLLNSIKFKYVTLMAINPAKGCAYDRIMNKEMVAGSNRPLSNFEIVQQIRDILAEVEPRGQKIGMFGEEVDIVGKNPINFRVVFDRSGKRQALKICDDWMEEHKDEKTEFTLFEKAQTYVKKVVNF